MKRGWGEGVGYLCLPSPQPWSSEAIALESTPISGGFSPETAGRSASKSCLINSPQKPIPHSRTNRKVRHQPSHSSSSSASFCPPNSHWRGGDGNHPIFRELVAIVP